MLANRFTRVGVLGLGLLVASACATGQAIRAGDAAAKRGEWDTAVARYREAAARNPSKVELQISLRQAMQAATSLHIKRAEALEAADQLPGAEAEYRIAADIDPSNTYALSKANEIERTIRARIDANRPRPSIEILREQAAQQSPIPKLDPRTRVPAMTLSGSVRDILTTIGQATGIDVTYDRDANTAAGVGYSLSLTDSSIDEALNQILSANQLTYKVVSSKRILIFQDSPTKHQQYDDQYIQTFPLSHADAQEVMQLIQQVFAQGGGGANRPIPLVNKTANTIIVKGTDAQLRVLGALIAANDKPRAEVSIDVEILEVDRTVLRQLGLDLSTYALGFQFSPEAAPNNTAAGTIPPGNPPPFSVNTITRGISSTDFYMTVPAAKIKLLEQNSTSKLLARPQVSGREGTPITLTLGDDIPVPQTTVPVQTNAGTFTTPSTSYNYRKVGVNLTITAKVTYQDEIILDPLTVERSAVGQNIEIAGQSLPTFSDRSATVALRLRDGESKVLAGLVRQDDRRTLSSLPGILHLPFLRALFGSSEQTIDQTDIVMIVTPRIIRGHELTAADLKPIFIGTGQNFGASGPPPLISLDAPPPAAVVAGGGNTGAGAANPPTQPGQPASGVTTPPAAPPPLNKPRAPGVVPIEAVPSNPPPATPVIVAASAPAGDIKAGGEQVVTVPITISGVSQMTGATLSISYDPKVLQATDVAQGSFLKSGAASTTFTPKIDQANGRIDVTLARPNDAGGASGEGMLVSITFKPLAAGQSPVAVSAVVNGAGGRTIQAQTTPAMLIVK